MSGRTGGPSDKPPASAGGPSTHRFQDRRQERMRGAGTHAAIQKDFQFKLPPRKQPEPSQRHPISSTPAASRRVSTASQPGQVRGRQSKGKQRDDILEEIGSQASSDEEDDAERDESLLAPDASFPLETQAGASGIVPDLSLPVIPSSPPLPSSSRLDASVHRHTDTSRGAALDDTLVQLDADESVVPQVESFAADSPAAKAAQRGADTRKRRRQPSPGAETGPGRPGPASKKAKAASSATAAQKAAKAKGKGNAPAAAAQRQRVLFQEPTEAELSDDLDADATLREGEARRRAGRPPGATGAMSKPQRKQFQQRLRRALSLVLPNSSTLLLGDAGGAADVSGEADRRGRKSRKLLNDIDVIWATLDEELKSTIASQPSKSVVSALKALRRSVKARCAGLSEKTDHRTQLVLDLTRARKRKKEVRRLVLETRREVHRSVLEEGERRDEVRVWQNEKQDVDKITSFLDDIRTAARTWT
ncbi:uncharacterized protein PSFLO_02595 [Pseudozyma flocculosa]|uniref:Uncharacterized protein n=1 Tax=Pseudozyma flocculosa TaxID=84751 RepID=A0A5C3EXY2_9BASI|nr:uncharacterized protein PSFLO_02595 [Pseudozyma flocculosa]